MALDADAFDVLTFDCYGTLVDWAAGISAALQPILHAHDVEIADDELFRLYGQFERDVESGAFVEYREVLRRVTRRFGNQFGFTPTNAEVERFAKSVGDWPLFADTNAALRRISKDARLAVVSNVDDALFRDTARRIDVEFEDVITAEQVRSYKPALAHFETAFTRLGVPPNRLLHVGQSVYHDINPAGRLGLSCVWVRRYGGRFDPPAPQTDPVLTVPDLSSLADALLA
jgi:2-haloacid dehalogenase